jgi:hypothetical protein
MKNSISINVQLTLSKIMGATLILGAIALGFYLKSETIVISLATLGASLIGLKTLVQQNKAK